MLLNSLRSFVRHMTFPSSRPRRRRQQFSGISAHAENLETRALLSATPAMVSVVGYEQPGTTTTEISAEEIQRMYRTYNSNADYTIFTTQKGEFEILNSWNGYRDQTTDRAGFGVLIEGAGGAGPIHRLYNPYNGQHYFTMNDGERDWLNGLGWKIEPDMGNAFTKDNAPAGAREIYMLYKRNGGDHMFTVDPEERDTLLASRQSWEQQTSLGYGFAVDANGSPDLPSGQVTPPPEFIIDPVAPDERQLVNNTIPAVAFSSLDLRAMNGDQLRFTNGPEVVARGRLQLNDSFDSTAGATAVLNVAGVDIPLDIGPDQLDEIRNNELDGKQVVVIGRMFGDEVSYDPWTPIEPTVRLTATTLYQTLETTPFEMTLEQIDASQSGDAAPERLLVTADSPLYQWLVSSFQLQVHYGYEPGSVVVVPGPTVETDPFVEPVPGGDLVFDGVLVQPGDVNATTPPVVDLDTVFADVATSQSDFTSRGVTASAARTSYQTAAVAAQSAVQWVTVGKVKIPVQAKEWHIYYSYIPGVANPGMRERVHYSFSDVYDSLRRNQNNGWVVDLRRSYYVPLGSTVTPPPPVVTPPTITPPSSTLELSGTEWQLPRKIGSATHLYFNKGSSFWQMGYYQTGLRNQRTWIVTESGNWVKNGTKVNLTGWTEYGNVKHTYAFGINGASLTYNGQTLTRTR